MTSKATNVSIFISSTMCNYLIIFLNVKIDTTAAINSANGAIDGLTAITSVEIVKITNTATNPNINFTTLFPLCWVDCSSFMLNSLKLIFTQNSQLFIGHRTASCSIARIDSSSYSSVIGVLYYRISSFGIHLGNTISLSIFIGA
jgi:hypothetical protein